ncbi:MULTISPECIES: hypothetical protein [Streptomyces]|nr:hypothetical protein [Streptomyces tricolor]
MLLDENMPAVAQYSDLVPEQLAGLLRSGRRAPEDLTALWWTW